ncbi:APC membrane recruitment protein 1 [Discoglossus pictus]
METIHGCPEETIGTKSSAICENLDSIPNSGKVEISAGPCVEQQSQGKQKKTPFKFFGGRKSICTLPSFFGGKHKGFGKGSSRKGLSKSKTHDCISDVPCEDGRKGCSNNSIDRLCGQETGQTLSSSQSADLCVTSPVKLDFNYHDASPLGSTECFDKKTNGEKSLSFPRPKKGLKGLFSSIRRHKKSKTPDTEKCVHYDHTTPFVIIEDGNKKFRKSPDVRKEIEQPKLEIFPSEISTTSTLNRTVCSEKEEILEDSVNLSDVAPDTISESPLETDVTITTCPEPALDTKSECSNPNENFPNTENVNNVVGDAASLSAGDQMSLIFDDVSSLKSFDSLTGCGDIIADQDIDNISDNTVSLERNRENTKRSSCLVTYQGGGEEMATPDDMEEEYLQQLLEDATETDASYKMEEGHESMKKEFIKLESSAYPLGIDDSYTERAVASNTELLTPQSDQQESAPNSDEGYYDSTTPGQEDDTGEGLSHKERLPRDSYSGDALYEFYEPDDSLMSPAPGSESLYETKTPCSEIFDQFFDFSLPTGNSLITDIGCKKGAMETEEERLAVIQKQLLFWEKQRETTLKGIENLNKDSFSKDTQNVECDNKTVNRTSRSKGCLSSDKVFSQNTSKDGVTKGGKQSWDDFQERSLRDSHYQGSFELNVDDFRAQDQSDSSKVGTPRFSNTKITPIHHSQNVFGMDKISTCDYDQGAECEQAVNFSETLVEFTNNDMLFSSISECLGNPGSSSSFHHNLDALPTMITFDIVDVENEGECDQQIELSPDEEVVESFDHSYVQESLADCEQLFHMDSQQPYHSYNWGVTSLPRHLGHYKMSPSMPAPLSLNRRSKSLDTECLDLELAGMQLTKSGLRSYDFLAPWEDGHCEEASLLEDDVAWDECDVLEQKIHTVGQFERYAPVIASSQGCSREPQGLVTNNQLSQDSRQMVRTSSAPLQCNTRQPHERSDSYRYYRENTTKKLALVQPLEEKRVVNVDQSSFFTDIRDKPVKTKPVGITQAMPQYHENKEESLKLPVDYQEQSGEAKKGTVELRDPALEHWSNTYSECTTSS